MERKLEEGHQEIKDSGYELSEDGLTLLKVTNAALDGNGHFTIPEGVDSIGRWAFMCTSLTTVHIPEGVTSIGHGAFANCTSLTTVHIPDSVTFIGAEAFSNCSSLTTVHISEGVTSIGDGAFLGCENLVKITIPEGVTFVGNWAFDGCTRLTTVHIPDSVTFIGAEAFSNCSSLTTVHISEGVTYIGGAAFDGCRSLTTVHIPDSVTFVGPLAFDGCTSLTHIIIETDNEAELNRIKNLLPENLRDKVISRSVYEFQRGMVDRFIFEAAGGDHFNDILHSLGLIVTAVNKIIASYLPGPVGHILVIIDSVGIPACLPNTESKETYRELLAQSIVPGLFQPVAQTPGTTQAAPQPVAPTRGQRPEQETNMCCVMQ